MRELLAKFWKELEHFKNGGEVEIVYDDGSSEPLINLDHIDNAKHLIIKDEYYTFRKALTEGKAIQYYLDEFVGWQDVVSTISPTRADSPKNYRIKPDEPKFKVGDWVTHKSKGLCKVESICPSGEPDDRNVWLFKNGACFVNELKLWEPQLNEWCLFWNDNQTRSARLSQFKQVAWGSGVEGQYKDLQGQYYNNCQPFIGELPPHLKD